MQYLHKALSSGQTLIYAWCEALHTRVDIVMYGDKAKEQYEEVCNEVEHELRRIEQMANRFAPSSEVSRINIEAYPQGCNCSEELIRIVQECEIFRERTQGAFNIAVHSPTNRGSKQLVFNNNPPHIRFLYPDTSIDLNGVIKGFALRNAHEILIRHHIPDALINLGNSSILARGNTPLGLGWKIAVAADQQEYTLINECLTTSGNDSDARRHILNPLTGESINFTGSRTVITYDPAWGEALATSEFVNTQM